jgi:hypothetical protein
MALELRGGEFFTTGALTARVIQGLIALAMHRPLVLNGQEVNVQQLKALAEEARKTGLPIKVPFADDMQFA